MFHFNRALVHLAYLFVVAQTANAQHNASHRWTPSSIQGFNASRHHQISSQSSDPDHTHNNIALVEALNVALLALWEVVSYENKNPLVEPALRNPVVHAAIDTMKAAIDIPNTPKAVPGPNNSTSNTTTSTNTMTNTTFHPDTIIGNTSLSTDVVRLHNRSPLDICFVVEFTSGSFPLPDICNFDRDNLPGQDEGILVPANSSTTVYTNADFNGPFNAILHGTRGSIKGRRALLHGVRGARHEINYASEPEGVWYDVDYEFGLGNSTLEPTDGRPLSSSSSSSSPRSSTQGEPNILLKARAAFLTLSPEEQAVLLAFPEYIRAITVNNDTMMLTHLHHDKSAPAVLNYFLQITAGLRGYVVPGSYPEFEAKHAPGSLEAVMRPVADGFSWFVKGAHDMRIVAY